MAQNSLSNFSRELLKEFCSMEQNHLSNFGRGLAKEHFSEIISKSVHWFSRGSCLKLFSIYSPVGHLVQQSGTV